MFNAISKNGTRITATLEVIPGTAAIDEGSWAYVGNPPVIGFVWFGETDVDWDGQETAVRNNKVIFVDEDGTEFNEDEIAIVDEEDQELVKEALEFPHVTVTS